MLLCLGLGSAGCCCIRSGRLRFIRKLGIMSHLSGLKSMEICDGIPNVITPDQCRMARSALRLGVRDLAKLAHVAVNTVTRLESGEGLHTRSVESIERALERAGVMFLPADDRGGAGVRLAKRSKRR